MSLQNVEIICRYFEEQGDATHLASFWEADGDYYPVRDYDTVRRFPEARSCHGREEIARFFAEFANAWENFRWTVKDVRPVGDDRVFVQSHLSAAGRTSGMTLEGDVFHCFWLRHGRFIRAEDHLTIQGALHALGLRGETLEEAGLRRVAGWR